MDNQKKLFFFEFPIFTDLADATSANFIHFIIRIMSQRKSLLGNDITSFTVHNQSKWIRIETQEFLYF